MAKADKKKVEGKLKDLKNEIEKYKKLTIKKYEKLESNLKVVIEGLQENKLSDLEVSKSLDKFEEFFHKSLDKTRKLNGLYAS